MSQPDEIIQKLLESRQKMTDVDAEAEQERQRRMYQMLRYSNHYKKLQVERANLQWDAKQVFDDDLEKALAEMSIKPKQRRVSFSDNLKDDDTKRMPKDGPRLSVGVLARIQSVVKDDSPLCSPL